MAGEPGATDSRTYSARKEMACDSEEEILICGLE